MSLGKFSFVRVVTSIEASVKDDGKQLDGSAAKELHWEAPRSIRISAKSAGNCSLVLSKGSVKH